MFSNLRHFEIYDAATKHTLHREFYDVLNQLISTADGLVSLSVTAKKKYSTAFVRRGEHLPTLHIPSTVEWLSLQNIGCDIDLSHCVRLLGVQFLGDIKYAQIR